MKKCEAGVVHDVCLVDGSDPLAAARLSVMKRVASHTLRSVPGDQLNGLNDTVDDLVEYVSTRSPKR